MWAAVFRLEESLVNLHVAAPAPPRLLLPPDFNALPLKKPEVMLEAESRMREGAPIGFIDTDCGKTIGKVFAATELLDDYVKMQKDASKIFKSALSEVARREWM